MLLNGQERLPSTSSISPLEDMNMDTEQQGTENNSYESDEDVDVEHIYESDRDSPQTNIAFMPPDQIDLNTQSAFISTSNNTKMSVEMPAICEICNSVYQRYESALRHVKYFHGLEDPKDYVEGTIGTCDYEDCTFTTVRTADFIRHIKNVHLKVCLFFVKTIFAFRYFSSHLYTTF